ncbi:arylacetamide deacetylase-like [Branchiostoma lanceolatum]|uniref:arylacetamide deacetylase-like n=1 Tax=Branchiostoma lanceolatum TaxID=7740 RepID=UPI0034512CA1
MVLLEDTKGPYQDRTMVIKAALAFVAAATVLAYYCQEPVPHDIEQPRFYAALGILSRTVRNMAKFGEFIGIGTEPQNFRYMTDGMLNAARKLKGDYREGLRCTDTTFDGVRVRVYEPESAGQSGSRRPGLVYIHGGGWFLMSVDTYDQLTAHLAKQLGVVVVSVEYRLAPEHKFPAAFDDSVAATKFFLKNAEKYNVDSKRIGISGDSAGGNLAAAVTQALAKEKGLPKLKTQALIYPALQAIDFNTPSFVDHGHLSTLSKDLMVACWLWYLNNDQSYKESFKANQHTSDQLKKSQYSGYVDNEMKSKAIVRKEDIKFPEIPNIETILDPRFAPLMAGDADLKGLPPTYVLTCEYDVLKDDGVMYGKRLEKAGVKVEYDNYERGFHGLLNHFEVYDLGGTAMENFVAYLKKTL